MQDIILTRVDRGSALPCDVKPILDEASELIAHLPDGQARTSRKAAMDKALNALMGAIVFTHQGSPIGLIYYDVTGDDARLLFGHILGAYENKKSDAFVMAVLELEKQFRVLRSNFNWPAPEVFSASARAMGFVTVERMGMSRVADAGHAVRPLSESLDILPYSSEYFDDVTKMMFETSDPADQVVYPLFGSVEGCRTMLRNILDGASGVFKPELTFVARDEGRLAGYLIATSFSDGIVHINDIAVAASFRGKGLASAMIDRLVRDSGAGGSKSVELAVTSSNHEALRLYIHKGFKVDETVMQHIFVARGRK